MFFFCLFHNVEFIFLRVLFDSAQFVQKSIKKAVQNWLRFYCHVKKCIKPANSSEEVKFIYSLYLDFRGNKVQTKLHACVQLDRQMNSRWNRFWQFLSDSDEIGEEMLVN